MVSRSFGDFEFKLQHDMDYKIHNVNYVSSEPDIRCVKLDYETDSFILLACDGVFDKMTSQQACDFVTESIS